MTALFIADLHLSSDHPRLIRGFLSLLAKHQDSQMDLYILGDWFNTWLDDADDSEWLNPIVVALQTFTQAGNRVWVLVGNRDFVLGQDFLNRFGGTLLQEPHYLDYQGHTLRLEHGDALCTDDVSYQRFKTIIRHPWVLGFLKRLPFAYKSRVATLLRKKSQQKQNRQDYQIIDVNPEFVQSQMHNIDVLIHGHTHRPEIECLNHGKRRVVLGDWREDVGEAQILYLKDPLDLQLSTWRF